jgi:iron complex outermembrane receptor protein
MPVASLYDYTVQVSPFLFGSPSIAPTAVWNAELGYNRVLASPGATLATSVFFQRNTNLIAPPGSVLSFLPDGVPTLTADNIGSSNEIGFELGLRGQTPRGFRWNASYRYASITDDITAAAAASPNVQTRYARGTPSHAVILGLGYTLPKWEFDAQGLWQSSYTDYSAGRVGEYPVHIGNYVTLNARIGYRVTEYLTLSGTAEQFNASRVLESAGDYVDRRFIASANVRF